jgi:outer membrane protein
MRKQPVTLLLCLVLSWTGYAQQTPTPQADNNNGNPQDTMRMPSITSPEGIKLTFPYRARQVSPPSMINSPRTYDLIRAGNLYLSLQDAISLVLENNLDIQLQRYTPLIAKTDLTRAQGGGLLRGLDYIFRELPPGEGGPGGPLLTTLGGLSPATSLTSNTTNTSVIIGQPVAVTVLGTIPASNGTSIPQFDPALTANLSWSHTSTPQTEFVQNGLYNLQTNTTNGGGGYSQGFATGTSLNATYVSPRINSNSNSTNYNPYTAAALGLTIDQPLLRGFGIDLNRRFIRIAANQQRIADLIFNEQLILTVSDIIALYWDFVTLREDVEVKRQALAAAQRLYDDNKSQVEVGTLAPLQLKRAQAEVARTRQDLISAGGLADQQELILKNAITRSGNQDPSLLAVHIIPLDHIDVPKDEVIPPLEDLIVQALRERPDIAFEKIQIDNANIALKGAKNALLPQLDIIGGLTNNALAGSVNPSQPGAPGGLTNPPINPAFIGGAGTLLSQIFTRDYPNYGIGVQLTIPLRNRIANADLVRDSLQVRQSEVRLRVNVNQVRVDVENARLALERSRASYDAAAETVSLQEEALQAEQERLAVGQSTSFNVIQFQRDLEQARSTALVAGGNYEKAKAALDRAMGRTLSTNGVKFDEGLSGIVSRAPSPLPPPGSKP